MSELDDSFTALLGRQPSDAEKQHLHQVKTALGLHNNDALWLLLIALEHYRHLYEEVPGRIEELTRRTLYNIQATAEMAMREAAAITQMELAKTVAATAEKVAQDTATKQKWQWLAVGVAVIALALLAAAGRRRRGVLARQRRGPFGKRSPRAGGAGGRDLGDNPGRPTRVPLGPDR